MQSLATLSNAVEHLMKINVRDEYRTPPELFMNGCNLFNFTPNLDVSESSVKYPQWLDGRTNLCKYSIKESDDLLKSDVNKDSFANLPYSKMDKLLAHLVKCHRKNKVSILVLCYSKTDTRWWKNNVLDVSSCVFDKRSCITGRVKFLCKHGYYSQHSAPYPSCWLFYDKDLL